MKKLIRSIIKIIKIIKITKKISIGIEITVKSLGEVVKVIILIIIPLLSLFPQQFQIYSFNN